MRHAPFHRKHKRIDGQYTKSLYKTQGVDLDTLQIQDTTYSTRNKALNAEVSEGIREKTKGMETF